jgi:KDO2-lipid IV(A) lauroyltransferase
VSWKKARHRLELLGVRILVALPRLLPFRAAVKLTGLLGVFAFDVFRIRRRVTLENLELAFGDLLSARERERIGRRSYVNFAKSMVEFASFGRLSRKRLTDLVSFTGVEHLDEALSRGRGVMAVTGHFGSWELLGAATVAYGYPADFLVGDQSNKLVDHLMNDLRREGGIGVIARGIAARGVFESLKDNKIVALLSDQDARRAGIFVDFFGTPASTYPGAAQFAYRMRCPIICCYIVRRDDESHEGVFRPLIEVRPEADKQEEVRRLTAAYTKEIERFVREHPEQYFWAHKRWKTKPSDAADDRAIRESG